MGDRPVDHGPVVIIDPGVVGGDPIHAISYLQPEHEWESGFAAWSVPPERADDRGSQLICLACFLDDHPEASRGMDLARRHGQAIYDGNDWN
jgi:hypothetical protein